MNKLKNCPDCNAEPGKIHKDNCDVERCSVCGLQKFGCDCENHDKNFSRWTGIWPGEAELNLLKKEGIMSESDSLNEFYTKKFYKIFFIKPK